MKDNISYRMSDVGDQPTFSEAPSDVGDQPTFSDSEELGDQSEKVGEPAAGIGA